MTASDLSRAADLLSPPRDGVLAHYEDPVSFTRECILWAPGKKPASYQEANMRALVEHGRVAIRGPRSLGKTAVHAWLILWFALTRDAARDDWKVLATAAVFRQLKDFLWGEVERKWSPKLDWEKIGRGPFRPQAEMMRDELRLRHGSVILAAATDPTKIEGAHADQMLVIYDEAKSVPDAIWDSVEGTFAGAGEDAEQVAYVIASSTPGAAEGRFADIHAGAPGLEDWHTIHVTVEQAIAERRVSPKYVKAREEQFGRESAWFQNHVLGEFAAQSHDGVISQVNLERAHERWVEMELGLAVRTSFAIPDLPQLGPLHAVGVDLAAGGEDRSVYALRYGNVIGALLIRPQEKDTTVAEAEVTALLRSAERQPTAVVDASGLGISIANSLSKRGLDINAFVASERSERRTREGLLGFADTRAAAWWNLREMLEPQSGMDLAIPPYDQLTADLLAPKWEDVGGKIRVESKKDIRKRLKRSTDAGDAVVQSCFLSSNESSAPPRVIQQASRWSPMREAPRESTPSLI